MKNSLLYPIFLIFPQVAESYNGCPEITERHLGTTGLVYSVAALEAAVRLSACLISISNSNPVFSLPCFYNTISDIPDLTKFCFFSPYALKSVIYSLLTLEVYLFQFRKNVVLPFRSYSVLGQVTSHCYYRWCNIPLWKSDYNFTELLRLEAWSFFKKKMKNWNLEQRYRVIFSKKRKWFSRPQKLWNT